MSGIKLTLTLCLLTSSLLVRKNIKHKIGLAFGSYINVVISQVLMVLNFNKKLFTSIAFASYMQRS